MVIRSQLEVSRDVPLGHVNVLTESAYVAVRSNSVDAVPYIKWTVLKVNDKNTENLEAIIVNPCEFGLYYIQPNTEVLWRPVQPLTLSRIVLTAPSATYRALSDDKETIIKRLPPFLRAGESLEDLGCHVVACEPVDEGLVPTEHERLSISVIENDKKLSETSHQDSIDVETYLNESPAKSLHLKVSSLRRPVPISSIMPRVAEFADTENFAFVKLSELAKLGIFSGDLVKLDSSTGKSRLVTLYSYPELNRIPSDFIEISPVLVSNLGNPETVTVIPASLNNADKPVAQPFEVAHDITLSRVSSPASTDKSNQAAFLQGLKSYFQGKVRVVKNNDLIPVPLNSSLSKLLGNNSMSDENEYDLLSLHDETSKFDSIVWFQVNGLPDENEYVVSASHTRMVQSGLAQRLAPPATIGWPSYFGLSVDFPYCNHDKLFAYAHTLKRLLRASIIGRGTSIKTTILLKSSKPGAGKHTVLKSVAAELGIHEMTIDALDVIQESDGKTLALLKARIERASTTNTCLVTIRHFDSLARKSDIDGKDTPLVNGLVDILDDLLSCSANNNNSNCLILAVTVSDPDSIADAIRNKFKFEVDVTVPTEKERKAIFDYLTSKEGNFYCLGQLLPQFEHEVFTSFKLRGDVSIDSLATQSAGLTPPDLCAIIKNAKQLASAKSSEDKVISCGGAIKLELPDLDAAIREARDNFSDSIGAPKIPNVGWKDVGGLDMVKGEILDTIDMPLKYPELFTSGLKKRSGILFYGPPGTGKTLLAKAIATNFSLNFFSVKGPELLNMYIGESEANVRRVFQKARDARPCVVFFDELDSVAPKRGNKGDSGGVMDRIVSQLLAELDGMSEISDGVFVVGATNRPDLLDEALLRPGRFDKMLYLGVSDSHEKQRKILEALTRKFELDPSVNLAEVAEKCPFTYTGADFYAMSSDAMLNAMTRTAGEVDAKINLYNIEHPDEPVTIRKWFQSIAQPDDVKVKVTSSDFEKAQRELVPSVSADELEHYLKVRNSFEGNN